MKLFSRLSSLRIVGAALGLLFCLAQPVLAYQVKVTQSNIQLKPQPDLRSGPEVQRLNPQRVQLLGTTYAADGELWCRISLANRKTGWIQARFLDPMLKDNQPLRLQDLPGTLIFDHAQREILYKSSLNSPSLKSHLRRWTLVMEMGLLKERWDSTRNRLNFLEISRRAGVKISDGEYRALQQEIRTVEQKFQRVLAEWQRS